MPLDIDRWNLADNRQWWVRLADSGAGILAELYLSEADAQAQTGLQAIGATLDYGSAQEIFLEADADATGSITMLQAEYDWHLKVSGASADDTRILRVGPFVELPEISHSIYRDARLIEARATAEINAHTHGNKARAVSLGIHLPETEPGDIVRLNSTRRSVDAMGQISGHRIVGEPNRLTSELDISFYLELTR